MNRILFSVAFTALMFTSVAFTCGAQSVPAGAVDLGVVVTRVDGTSYKLYWAASNLSEDGLCPKPEDLGDYYAWGETVLLYHKGHSQDNPCEFWREYEGKIRIGYGWHTYKWSFIYDKRLFFTKYCPKDEREDDDYYWGGREDRADNKSVLETGPMGDDAASKQLGGKWRMPTDREWTALRKQCTWTWSGRNGVKGYEVTGPNGKSIFLPAAGGRSSDVLNYVGSYGYYWSSSLNTEYPYGAGCLYFDSGHAYGSYGSRYCGFSVRPVSE